MVRDELNCTAEFQLVEATVLRDAKNGEPDFRLAPAAIDMDMRRFMAVRGEEVKAKACFSQEGRHCAAIHSQMAARQNHVPYGPTTILHDRAVGNFSTISTLSRRPTPHDAYFFFREAQHVVQFWYLESVQTKFNIIRLSKQFRPDFHFIFSIRE